MEWTLLNIVAYILIPILTAGIGGWVGAFLGDQVLREQVRDQMYFDKNGEPVKDKIDTLLKDIDLGLWDSYLMWNYENYQSVKAQVQMGQIICNPQLLINPMTVSISGKKDEKEVK